jgi:hypothetical protein
MRPVHPRLQIGHSADPGRSRQADRQRARLSPGFVLHTIGVPAFVTPVAPSGEQNAPGWTPMVDDEPPLEVPPPGFGGAAGAGAGAGRGAGAVQLYVQVAAPV